MVSTSWTRFVVIVMGAFLVVNTIFALLYLAVGIEHLKNAAGPTATDTFLNAFFFSAHTLTTVGYGNMWPVGTLANLTAVVESLLGVLSFALATGLMFGRFSRPSARFSFSKQALVSPYLSGSSIQFRLANRRSNTIINLDANVLLMTVEDCGGKLQRKFEKLALERDQILFFPLAWTVVHPINESSPLWGKTAEDFEKQQAELLVLVRGFDDTFAQTVHARYSYRHNEIFWGQRFAPAFEADGSGNLVIDLELLSKTIAAPLPPPISAASQELGS